MLRNVCAPSNQPSVLYKVFCDLTEISIAFLSKHKEEKTENSTPFRRLIMDKNNGEGLTFQPHRRVALSGNSRW